MHCGWVEVVAAKQESAYHRNRRHLDAQNRGFPHDTYNFWSDACGVLVSMADHATALGGEFMDGCRSVSRYSTCHQPENSRLIREVEVF